MVSELGGLAMTPHSPAGTNQDGRPARQQCVCLAVLLTATLWPWAGFGQDRPAKLMLDYQAFDQIPAGGWRKLADAGRCGTAARLIDRYETESAALETWQRMSLRFHAGQLHSAAGEKDVA